MLFVKNMYKVQPVKYTRLQALRTERNAADVQNSSFHGRIKTDSNDHLHKDVRIQLKWIASKNLFVKGR